MVVFLGHWARAVEGMTTRRTNEDKHRHRQFTKRLLVTTLQKILYAVCKYTNSCSMSMKKKREKSTKFRETDLQKSANTLKLFSCCYFNLFVDIFFCEWFSFLCIQSNPFTFVDGILIWPCDISTSSRYYSVFCKYRYLFNQEILLHTANNVPCSIHFQPIIFPHAVGNVPCSVQFQPQDIPTYSR